MKKILAKGYIYLILLLLYFPLVTLVVFSFTEARTLGQWSGFSLQLFADLFTDANVLSALLNTVILGVVAASLSTIIGTLAAIGLYNMKKRARNVCSTLSQIPIMNADVVAGFSLMLLFTMLGFPDELLSGWIKMILAHTLICTPFVVLNVLPRLHSMDPNVYEAALDLGASPMKALLRVLLPQLIPVMITSFVLGFTLSIDDFVISSFVISDFNTISTYIYGVMKKKGLDPTLRALSSMIFILVLTAMILLNVFSARQRKKAAELAKLKKNPV